MLDYDLVELGYGIANRVVVSLEERFLDFEFSFNLADDQLGVAFTCDLSCA